MKSKESEKKTPVAISDDALDAVSGGAEPEVYDSGLLDGFGAVPVEPSVEGVTFVGAIVEE